MSRGPPTPGTKTSGRWGPGASGCWSVTGKDPPCGGWTTVTMSGSLAERARPRLDKLTARTYDGSVPELPPPGAHAYELPVRYGDTDQMGVAYYANYLY